MKVLITGGSGFVGMNLSNGLQEKYEILTPQSKELNLTDYKSVGEYLDKNKIEVVIHTATHSTLATERDGGFQVDLRMLTSLTRNLNKINKLIVFGSGAEYGKTRDIIKAREDEWGEFVPDDLYGLSKFLTNEIVRREPKMINLRLFGIYGPCEDYRHKFISNAIVKNLLGLPIRIKQDVVFDYLYVTDLIPVVEYFLTHESKYRDYNVSSTESIKLSGIVNIVNEVAERKSSVEVANSNLNYEYTSDNTRLRQEIPNWQVTDYMTGIQKLFDYYRKIIPTVDKKIIQDDEYYKKTYTK